MNKLRKVAAAFGVALAAGTTLTVTATSASAETFDCYRVTRDAVIYEYPGLQQGSIAEGRLLRGYRDGDSGDYWAVRWWKYGAGDTTWESLWTLSSSTDDNFVHSDNLYYMGRC